MCCSITSPLQNFPNRQLFERCVELHANEIMLHQRCIRHSSRHCIYVPVQLVVLLLMHASTAVNSERLLNMSNLNSTCALLYFVCISIFLWKQDSVKHIYHHFFSLKRHRKQSLLKVRCGSRVLHMLMVWGEQSGWINAAFVCNSKSVLPMSLSCGPYQGLTCTNSQHTTLQTLTYFWPFHRSMVYISACLWWWHWVMVLSTVRFHILSLWAHWVDLVYWYLQHPALVG